MSMEGQGPDPLDGIDPAALEQEHPDLGLWKHVFDDYNLIYRGGKEFLLAAGGKAAQTVGNDFIARASGVGPRQRRFLHQLQGEPDEKYTWRWGRAFHINYVAAIVDYFRHYLFSQPPVIRPVDTEAAPAWWEDFHPDCTGGGQSLLDFIKEAFLGTLIERKSGWLVGKPAEAVGEMTEGQAEEMGVSGVVLTGYTARQIKDWQCNATGELEWVMLERSDNVRHFPGDRVEVTTYTFVDRQRWRSWAQTSNGQFSVVGDGVHGLGEVPFVMLEVPHGLWILDKLASWQIDLFNKSNMLSYGELMACFPQPYLKSNDQSAKSRIFGEGVLLSLKAGSQLENGEEFGYATTDISPFAHTAKRCLEQRDEGYRIVHQMSLAVDSRAIGAIARSGASKIEDRRATEVILCGYGALVKDALVRTTNLVSNIKGDKKLWMCTGFDRFMTSSLEEELSSMALVKTFGIKSRTFNERVDGQIATGNVLRNMDEATRNAILEEIKGDYDDQEEATLSLSASGGDPAEIELTPSTIGVIMTVNEARKLKGLDVLRDETGTVDPDGNLTISEFEATKASVIEAANMAQNAGKPEPKPFGHPGFGGPPKLDEDGKPLPPDDQDQQLGEDEKAPPFGKKGPGPGTPPPKEGEDETADEEDKPKGKAPFPPKKKPPFFK